MDNMCSLTFDKVIKLKKELLGNYNYNFIFKKQITDLMSNRKTIAYLDLLKNTDGIFPTDLLSMLSEKEKTQIDFSLKCKKSFINNNHSIYDELPPPHLANFEWRYSRDCIEKIVNQIEKNKYICCLGTPTIAIELIYRGYPNITLLDINEPIINTIKTGFRNKNPNCRAYNVLDNLPEELKSCFDMVIIDPPWYLDYYELFLFRSIQLINATNGNILLPIFPVLSHRSACFDLIYLYNYILESGAKNLRNCGYVEYDMPEFEKLIILENKIPIPDNNWRCAELINIEYDNTSFALNNIVPPKINDFIYWDRKYNPKDKNYYVANTHHLFPLKSEYVLCCEQMMSISRKNFSRKKIVAWDNKNRIIVAK